MKSTNTTILLPTVNSVTDTVTCTTVEDTPTVNSVTDEDTPIVSDTELIQAEVRQYLAQLQAKRATRVHTEDIPSAIASLDGVILRAKKVNAPFCKRIISQSIAKRVQLQNRLDKQSVQGKGTADLLAMLEEAERA